MTVNKEKIYSESDYVKDNLVLSSNVNYFSKGLKKDSHTVAQKNAKNLRDFRKKKGYTLYDLAKLSGLSPSYISRLEGSSRRFNTETLSKLALALGCDELDFFKNDSQSTDTLSLVELGFKKDLPIYRVISEGLDVSDNPHSVIVFSSVMEYTFRPPKLSFSSLGFAVYAVNNLNSPRYFQGDLLYFDASKDYKVGDTIMVVDFNNYLFIGSLLYSDGKSLKIKYYSKNFVIDFKDNHSIDKIFKLVTIQCE